jgi:hypothetical protein
MSILLDLRGRLFHTGIPLVHPTSEHVVLANVFGTIKNFSADAAINPWLESATGNESVRSEDWKFSFWEKQQKPMGAVGEGSTEVDLVLESDHWLVFVEVKMDADAKAVASDMKPKQCFADANVWFDEAENGLEIPTEDLLRRKYEMDPCYALASKLNSRKGEKAVLLMKIESVTYR